MAYDDALAQRIRTVLAGEGAVEKKAFGGLAFMLDGNMAVAAGSRGDLMVRCDPDASAGLIADGAVPMEMRGRTMTGWLLVDPELLTADDALRRWVAVGRDYARTLPPK